MSWRRRIGAVIGVAAVVLSTVAIVAPTQILRYLPPVAERFVAHQSVQPTIAIMMAVYAGWMLFSRGWLTPVRDELTASTGTESENDSRETDAESTDSEPRPESPSHDPSANAPESVPFSSQTETRVETEPPVGSHVISISPDKFEELRSKAPEQPQPNRESIVGSDFDESFQKGRRLYAQRDDLFTIFDVDADLTEQSASSYPRPEKTVRSRIVALGKALEQSQDGSINSRVDISEWTRDAAVRSFLDQENADVLPLLDRVRVWLTPETIFERVVEQSIKTLEEIDDWESDR
jgi:hypothetical protein